jgi:hypothetical protein
MIYVIRNDREYGPYTEELVAGYVEEGKLLMHDKARDAMSDEEGTVMVFLERRGLCPRVKDKGTIMQQLRRIGREFIFPKEDMTHSRWLEDKRLLVLAIVGLSLSVLMLLPIGGYVVFYAISLYFSVIMGNFLLLFLQDPAGACGHHGVGVLPHSAGRLPHLLGVEQAQLFLHLHRGRIPLGHHRLYPRGRSHRGVCQDDAPPLLVRRAKEPLLPQTLVYYV